MPDDDLKPHGFQASVTRLEELKELARQLREGSDVPREEQMKRLKTLTEEMSRERPEPTRADKERWLEELRKQHGNLPDKMLMLKGIGEHLKDLRTSSQAMRQPSIQDLEKAILMGDVEQVHRLIAGGIDVNGQSASGGSLLMLAGIQGHEEIARALREAGASVGLLEAALLGDVDTLQVLLDGGVDVDTRSPKTGYTALNWAASKGKIEIVDLLLERSADVNSANAKGFTPLLSAALSKHERVAVRLVTARLVEAGASVGVVEAALLGDEERLVHLLDEGADLESENTACMTPLMAAAACGHIACIRLLLDRGADLNRVDGRHHSALTWAINRDQHEAVHLLLDAGMDINAPDHNESEYLRGGTPIRAAILHRLPEMVRLLIKRGARVNVRDARGQTPLHWAAMTCSPDVMRLLLDAGADSNAVGAMQRTPLMSVVQYMLVEKDIQLACVRLLLERGALVNARAEHGTTALMIAAAGGHTEIVKILLDAGADINATDEHGFSALHAASQAGHANVIALLKQRGAKGRLIENFLVAALFGHKDVLKTLLLPRLRRPKQQKTKNIIDVY